MKDKIYPLKDRLKYALEYRNMRPVDLCEKTEISQSTMSQYLSGYAEPKKARLAKIANALNVEPTWLMGFDEEPHTHDGEKELYIVLANGCVGRISGICTCDECKKRGEVEIFINCLDGKYLACVKHHELFDNDIILNAGHSIEELSEVHNDIEIARLFIDMYHNELLKVKTKGA